MIKYLALGLFLAIITRVAYELIAYTYRKSREHEENKQEKTKHIYAGDKIVDEILLKLRPESARCYGVNNEDSNGFNYYIYGEEETHHDNCYKCSTNFQEGDKVYLTNNYHQYDVITPFPYCKTCIQKYGVANRL